MGSDATSGVDSCTGEAELRGARYTRCVAQRLVLGSRGQPEWAGRVRPQIRRDCPARGRSDPGQAAGPGNWYNHPVVFAVEGSDATSGIGSCPPVTYSGPDAADAAVVGVCIDNAGNQASRSFPLAYDATGPPSTASADRGPDANGWYSHVLTVSFTGFDHVSGTDFCTLPQSYDGPDGAEVMIGGACTDRAGNVGLAALSVSYDATAPEVTSADPARVPDANGWYRRPLVVRFRGSDMMSQIDSCTEASYSGPDATDASVSGSCRDRAGNGSASLRFALRYDSTAPSLTRFRVEAGNRTAKLSWIASPDTAFVELRRSGVLVYGGSSTSFTDRGLKNGVRYRYELTAFDAAGNAATSGVAARPTGPLVSPPTGATVSAPPRLAWLRDERATHVQRPAVAPGKDPQRVAERDIAAAPAHLDVRRPPVPPRARALQVVRLARATGPRGQKKFGRLLGSSSFVVR